MLKTAWIILWLGLVELGTVRDFSLGLGLRTLNYPQTPDFNILPLQYSRNIKEHSVKFRQVGYTNKFKVVVNFIYFSKECENFDCVFVLDVLLIFAYLGLTLERRLGVKGIKGDGASSPGTINNLFTTLNQTRIYK